MCFCLLEVSLIYSLINEINEISNYYINKVQYKVNSVFCLSCRLQSLYLVNDVGIIQTSVTCFQCTESSFVLSLYGQLITLYLFINVLLNFYVDLIPRSLFFIPSISNLPSGRDLFSVGVFSARTSPRMDVIEEWNWLWLCQRDGEHMNNPLKAQSSFNRIKLLKQSHLTEPRAVSHQ